MSHELNAWRAKASTPEPSRSVKNEEGAKAGEWFTCVYTCACRRLCADTRPSKAAGPSGLRRWISTRSPRVQIALWTPAGVVLGSPEFNSSVVLVNSQRVCLRRVGILTGYVYLKYLFLSLFVGHNVNYRVTSNCVILIKSNFLKKPPIPSQTSTVPCTYRLGR